MTLTTNIAAAIVKLAGPDALSLVRQAIEQQLPPLEIINQGIHYTRRTHGGGDV
ncbi:MAG: hypothetical protein ACE5FD_13605 [Anaerolineae bacterium]